ncbi:surface antigen [Weissella oryzae SG25]|uniref:Surface antigen n=1 Tax=Weissella oryzae (strain DSM 25784 / JCM 18191 / LMG 30913 / SG25) TaxID=1329250 RepID=A0A069D3E4_WEIOS|nr:phage tail tip lysozyme [Weissella oryzae]GAK31906.1 surface antigen [Weissella oryzae SG25]
MRKILKFYTIMLAAIVLLLILIIGLISNTKSQQCDSDNTGSNVVTSADKQQTAKSIYDNLKKQPNTTDAGIAAYLGNTEVESGINSNSIQSGAAFNQVKAMDKNLSGYAFGFNQWDSGRRVNLLNYATKQSKSWTDPSLQLDFALNNDGADSTLLKQGLAMTDVSQATEFLRAKWERGGVGTTEKRTKFAKQWYSELAKGGDTPATDVADSGLNSATNENKTSSSSSGCKVDTSEGMASSGAPVTEMPANYKGKVKNTNFTATSPTNTYPFGQCTWYVFNRMQALGTPVENYLGNGADWGANAKAKGYTTDTKPHAGWAISFTQGAAGADPTYGHVAVVEAISDDGSHFLVSECNVVNSGSGTVSFRELTAGNGMIFIQGKH